MNERLHRTRLDLRWSGNSGAGTASYRGYSRAHRIEAEAGVVVRRYDDAPSATLREDADGAGKIVAATLRPSVGITASGDTARARSLHRDAHEKCFIARSVNFAIEIEPVVGVEDASS